MTIVGGMVRGESPRQRSHRAGMKHRRRFSPRASAAPLVVLLAILLAATLAVALVDVEPRWIRALDVKDQP